MRKLLLLLIGGIVCVLLVTGCKETGHSNNRYVNKWIGTASDGRVTPVASVPFGMMQIGADTRSCGSGYHYDDSSVLGFSHLHKSGGGCADFLDILFMPLPLNEAVDGDRLYSKQYQAALSHQEEKAEPGYYSVNLYNKQLTVELTASRRCGIQRYRYTSGGVIPVVVDLNYGSECACTIQPEHDVDTVYISAFELVDSCTIRGYRFSNGWTPGQQVYFYSRFSSPIKTCALYVDDRRIAETSFAEGRNIKALLSFENECGELTVKTALSSVSME